MFLQIPEFIGSHLFAVGTHPLMVAVKKDWFDYFIAIAPVIAAFVACGVAIHQKQIMKKQTEVQRTSFLYEQFAKKKQEKILELRNLYIDFRKEADYFISMIFPGGITEIPQHNDRPPLLTIENSNNLLGIYTEPDVKDIIETCLVRGLKVSKELEIFLKNNDVFFENASELLEYLQLFVRMFHQLYQEILDSPTNVQFFSGLEQKFVGLASASNYKYCAKAIPEIISARKLVLEFIRYRLTITKNGVNDNLLYMTDSTYWKKARPAYNETEWANNEYISFETHHFFQIWFNTCMFYIDNFVRSAFTEIKKIENE